MAWASCLCSQSQLFRNSRTNCGRGLIPETLCVVSNNIVNRLFIGDSCFLFLASYLFSSDIP